MRSKVRWENPIDDDEGGGGGGGGGILVVDILRDTPEKLF